VYDIISDIGVYGDITVKESFLSSTRVDKTKGMKLHKGWFEGFMVNNTKEMTFTAHNCYCLLFNDTIRSMTDVLPYIQYAIGKSAGLVIFCDDISDITLKQIKHSMESQPLPICFVENDGSRDRKDMLLNDLAALTRAYIVSHGVEFDPENLGMADEIKVEEMFTTVMSTNIDNETVDAIVSDIKSRLAVNDAADDMFLSTVEKKFYRKRLANLTGGVAVIHVGGATEMEMRELKDRLDDAVLAVTCAIRDGVCVGGGYTYLHAEQDLSKKASNKVESVVFSCLSAVFKQLLINADLFNKHDVIKKKLLKGYGYDLRNNSFVPKHDYKVYDAAGVLLDSVTNAIAASKSVLSVRKIVFDGIIRSN
jgi:chaperonin GroEL